MAGRKTGRNLRGRDAGGRRALGGHRPEVNLWEVGQSGPGRTGAGAGAGTAEDLWGEGDAQAGAVLEDCGGRARVGDSRGGRGLGRLGSFERSEEHTSELQSPCNLVCRLLLEKKKNIILTYCIS